MAITPLGCDSERLPVGVVDTAEPARSSVVYLSRLRIDRRALDEAVGVLRRLG